MSNVLPSEAIANEVFGLESTPKAMLLNELTDSVLQAQEGFKTLTLSSDATQWVKSLTIIDTLTVIECLAHSIKSNLMLDPIEQKIAENERKIDALLADALSFTEYERKIDALLADALSFTEYRVQQGHETCPCGDMDVYSCAGQCGWGDA
jgi:hypothetical protein